MNPDLNAIWQTVLAKGKALTDSGEQPLSAQEIDDYIQRQSKGQYSLKDITGVNPRNIGRSFAEGLTLNHVSSLFGPQATAGGNLPSAGARGGLVRTPEQMQAAYIDPNNSGLDTEVRNRLFREAHPGVATNAENSGFLANALLTEGEGNVVEGAPSFLSFLKNRVLPSTAKGAAIGGAAAHNETDIPQDDAANTALGVGIGGVLGTLFPSVLGAVEYARSPKLRAATRLQADVEAAGGPDVLATKNREFAEGGRGDNIVFADLAPELRARLEQASSTNPDVHAAVSSLNAARNSGRPELKLNDIREILHPEFGGMAPSTTPGVEVNQPLPVSEAPLPFGGSRPEGRTPGTGQLGALVADRNAWAAGPTGYAGLPRLVDNTQLVTPPPTPEQIQAQQSLSILKGIVGENPSPAVKAQLDALEAQAAGPQLNPSEKIFADFLNKPGVRDALASAQRAGMNDTPSVPQDAPTLKKLIAIRQQLRAMATAGYNTGRGDIGGALSRTADALTDHLVENVPGFSAVNEQYAERMGLERAADAGVDAWNDPESRGISKVMAKLSPTEKDNYRYQMASELVAKLRGQSAQSMATQLDNPSAAMQDKLKTIFGSQFNFDVFMKRAELDRQIKLLGNATNNSKTVLRNNMNGVDPLDMGLQAASTNYASGPNMLKSALMRAGARFGRAQAANAAAEAVAKPLLTSGTPAIDELIQSFRNPPQRMVPQAPLGLPGFLAGSLAGNRP